MILAQAGGIPTNHGATLVTCATVVHRTSPHTQGTLGHGRTRSTSWWQTDNAPPDVVHHTRNGTQVVASSVQSAWSDHSRDSRHTAPSPTTIVAWRCVWCSGRGMRTCRCYRQRFQQSKRRVRSTQGWTAPDDNATHHKITSQQIKVTTLAYGPHDTVYHACAIPDWHALAGRTMRKSTPSKPLHITHGLVLDVPCHNHCSFAPRRATASTRALTCCSMSLCSCMYLFHRYRFWTLRSMPRNGTPHQGPEHANIHGTCRTNTCTPLHCYHPCSGKRVSKLPSCATPFLAVFMH